MAENSLDVKLATYAERLDRYMETQESLNKRLVGSIESGAKTSLIAVGILITQTVVIMGSLAALTGWTNNR